jgi:hypothetical protein
MKTLRDLFLSEASIFGAMAINQNILNQCAEKCRNAIRNDKNQQSRVSVCTSGCKVKYLQKLMSDLQMMRGRGVPEETLNAKIIYVKTRLDKEMMNLTRYRSRLVKRQTTIPVSMSLKPSPERPDPKY